MKISLREMRTNYMPKGSPYQMLFKTEKMKLDFPKFTAQGNHNLFSMSSLFCWIEENEEKIQPVWHNIHVVYKSELMIAMTIERPLNTCPLHQLSA